MTTQTAVDPRRAPLQSNGMAEPVTPREKAAILAEKAKAELGGRLTAWREHKGFDRKELAFFADISEDNLRILEEGRPIPDGGKRPSDLYATNLLRISLCLGVSLDDLMLNYPPARPAPSEPKKQRKGH